MILWITLSHKLKYHFEIAIQLFIDKFKFIKIHFIKKILNNHHSKYNELHKVTSNSPFNRLKKTDQKSKIN